VRRCVLGDHSQPGQPYVSEWLISDPVSDCADHTTAEATRTRGDGSIELPTDIEPEYDFPDNTGTSNRRQLDVVIGLYGVYVGK